MGPKNKPSDRYARGFIFSKDQAADQLGLEGVIGKRADSPYRAGTTPNWVKVKTAHGRHIDEERAKWNE